MIEHDYALEEAIQERVDRIDAMYRKLWQGELAAMAARAKRQRRDHVALYVIYFALSLVQVALAAWWVRPCS